MSLQAHEIEQYKKQGYIIPEKPLFEPEMFNDITERFNALLKIWEHDYKQMPEEMDKPHFFFPELFEYLLHPRVLDVVESIIGPDIILFTSHFICKPAGTGKRVPWHEDSSYWNKMIEPMEDTCTIWLAVDPSSENNGCLKVIPKTHLDEDLDYQNVPDPEHAVFKKEIKPDLFNVNDAVSLEIEPGEYSIHHAKIIHGSDANTSDVRRCGFTMRYFSAHSKFLQKENQPHFDIYLARGQNIAQNKLSEPGKINEPWKKQVLSAVS